MSLASQSIKLEIGDVSSTDVDLSTWRPDSSSDVYFSLDMEIGELGDQRRDLFYVTVATPEGLREHCTKTRNEGVISERNLLVISEYSLPELQRLIENIVKKSESSTWRESVTKLQRYFQWEYEDYSKE